MKIKVENLHKAYGENRIHKGVTFEIPSGQKCVIVGGSGVGKSQLIRQIVGLVECDQGKIYLDEQEVTGLSEAKLNPIRQKIGFIFQDGGLLLSLTVGENITLPLREIQKLPKKEIDQKLDDVLKLLDLEGMKDSAVSEISGGQRKRVAIARALVCDVKALFYDEPTAGLDPITARTVDDVINSMNDKTGATTVVVTHDLRSLDAIGERVLMLYDGVIHFDGTPKEFYASEDKAIQEFLDRERHTLEV